MKKVCCTCKQTKDISEFHQGQKRCKECRKEKNRIFYLKNKQRIFNRNYEYDKNNPWMITLRSINQRCNNPKNKRYYCYGGRGIKCLITAEELKELWFRDKAYLMKNPSIDRIDNDGDYCYDNCQFIETAKHAKKTYKERTIDKKGRFTKCYIKE